MSSIASRGATTRFGFLLVITAAAACSADAGPEANTRTQAAFQPGSGPTGETRAGTGTVSAAKCAKGAPAVVWVDEAGIPSAMALRSTKKPTLTIKNCSGKAWWPGAAALGSRNPEDNTTWGFNRVVLPAAVPHGSQIALGFEIDAPPLTGKLGFRWQMVEGVDAWIGSPGPNHVISVQALRTASAKTVCTVQTPGPGQLEQLVPNGTPGATAVTAYLGANDGDPATADGDAATAELERCIQAALRTPPANPQTHTVLALPAHVYRLPSAVDIEAKPGAAACGAVSDQISCDATSGCGWSSADSTSCPTAPVCHAATTQASCAAAGCRWDMDPKPACDAFAGSCQADCKLCKPISPYPIEITTENVGASDSCFGRDQGGLPVRCAVLQIAVQAGDGCEEAGAIVTRNVSKLILDHIVIDGNKTAREAYAWNGTRYASSSAAFACNTGLDPTPTCPGQWTKGYNGRLGNCAHCVVRYSAFTRALCGTGIAIESSNGIEFVHNSVRYNGFHVDDDDPSPSDALDPPERDRYESMWADGMTVNSESGTDGATIEDNDFRENTDVGGIGMSRVTNSIIRNNVFFSFDQHTHSAIHFGDGKDRAGGCYAGTVVEGNVIDGGAAQVIHHAISIGARIFHGKQQLDQSHGACAYTAWSRGDDSGHCADAPSGPNAEVKGNTIRRARAGIDLAAATGFVIKGNEIVSGGKPIHNVYRSCTHETRLFNVDPDSAADGGNVIGKNQCAGAPCVYAPHLSWDDSACP